LLPLLRQPQSSSHTGQSSVVEAENEEGDTSPSSSACSAIVFQAQRAVEVATRAAERRASAMEKAEADMAAATAEESKHKGGRGGKGAAAASGSVVRSEVRRRLEATSMGEALNEASPCAAAGMGELRNLLAAGGMATSLDLFEASDELLNKLGVKKGPRLKLRNWQKATMVKLKESDKQAQALVDASAAAAQEQRDKALRQQVSQSLPRRPL